MKTQILVFSHHFVVKSATKSIRKVLYHIASDYTQFGFVFDPVKKKRIWQPTKTFAFYSEKLDEFRYHIGMYEKFIQLLITQEEAANYSIEYIPLYVPDIVQLPVNPKFILREDQEEASRFILENTEKNSHYPLLAMATGTGKTVTSLVTASRISYRLGVVVLSMYVDKWKSDIANTYLLDKKDILTIKGSDQLIDLTQLAVENEHHTEKLPKVIIFSLNTLSKWYSDYLKDSAMPKLMSFGFPPYELMEKLRIGTLIFDEAHQFLHAVCRTFCFIHIPKTISLTATLLSKDPAEIRIQNMMYPRHKRFEEIKMKQYIQCFACNYVIMNMHLAKIRTSEFGSNGTYSHPAFEKSLLAHRTLRQQYIDMIVDMVVKTYHDGYIQGDRCAVFVSTAKMADIICEAIKKKLPKYDTRTYLERDPIENMRDSDIRVTTILSGGTAHDVANLRVCIQTISIDSPKSNIQVLGRLRELKDRDVKFYYLYCESIPKHVDYHINRQTLYRSRVAKLLKVWLPPLKP